MAINAVVGVFLIAAGIVSFIALDRGGILYAPVCGKRLAWPYWAALTRGVVADGEDEIHPRRVGTTWRTGGRVPVGPFAAATRFLVDYRATTERADRRPGDIRGNRAARGGFSR